MLKLLIKMPAIMAIRFYQAIHGSFFTGSCRFYPTCSHYAIEAIETRGLVVGSLLAAYRVLRCQPFCKGGWDPVPTSSTVCDPVPAARAPWKNFSGSPKVWNTLRIASSAGHAFVQPRPQNFRRRT